ncbi:MAG: bifunctional sugar-1-phosphate nucleotidylyltransferase/acetyltransferase [Caldisphaera sp.]|jgi:bifunctional UDP-N-acetylglucosamine pyrophosphorylase/glucosamine-1-phosphate N-acetyltransferase|nr:sugar phosphate nucleotidyltransferase [Caldisphaera sp.]PMP59628.1 MAG: nucleotidyl transferase [Caldisphaera sp.]
MKKLVLMAAGKGERLRPLTETRQKTLMPILGQPLICRHINEITKYFNFDEIIVIVSYMKDQVINAIKSCSNLNNIKFVDQIEEKGTGHAIKIAMENGGNADYLIVYSDVYLSKKIYERLVSLKNPGIVATGVDDPWNYGIIKTQDGILKDIIEKPKSQNYFNSNKIFGGILNLPYEIKHYLDNLKKSLRGEYEVTDALKQIISSFDVDVLEIDKNSWQDIGKPWDLLIANRLAIDEEITKPEINGTVDKTAVIDGNVLIGKGSKIGPYVVIEGPVYISENVKIGPCTHIRPYTVILSNAKVGYSVEVKGSIVMEEAKLPHFNYVGDSIIGENVNLGAGTITANLRFDHKPIKMMVKNEIIDTKMEKLGVVMGGNSQTGINVSILPGKKIGSYALIYPGCVVDRDVNSKEVFKCK